MKNVIDTSFEDGLRFRMKKRNLEIARHFLVNRIEVHLIASATGFGIDETQKLKTEN